MLATVVGAGRCLLEFKTRGSKLASTIYIYIYRFDNIERLTVHKIASWPYNKQ